MLAAEAPAVASLPWHPHSEGRGGGGEPACPPHGPLKSLEPVEVMPPAGAAAELAALIIQCAWRCSVATMRLRVRKMVAARLRARALVSGEHVPPQPKSGDVVGLPAPPVPVPVLPLTLLPSPRNCVVETAPPSPVLLAAAADRVRRVWLTFKLRRAFVQVMQARLSKQLLTSHSNVGGVIVLTKFKYGTLCCASLIPPTVCLLAVDDSCLVTNACECCICACVRVASAALSERHETALSTDCAR